jgi:putative SOS response-associated peptidase YedK
VSRARTFDIELCTEALASGAEREYAVRAWFGSNGLLPQIISGCETTRVNMCHVARHRHPIIVCRSYFQGHKPAFRDAFVSRRCLLPAEGFFEWTRTGKEKRPFHFGMRDDSLFAFAGLWDRWNDPAGSVIESCTILTTAPNSLLADVHDRMRVILPQDSYDLWLDPGFKDVKALAEILAPFDASQMKKSPVSTRINAVANDDPDCIVPRQSSPPAQTALFR